MRPDNTETPITDSTTSAVGRDRYRAAGRVLDESLRAIAALHGARLVRESPASPGDSDDSSPTLVDSLERLAPAARPLALLALIAGAPWTLPHFPDDRDREAVYGPVSAAFELAIAVIGVTLARLAGRACRDLAPDVVRSYGTRAIADAQPAILAMPGLDVSELTTIFANMVTSAGRLLVDVCADPAAGQLAEAAAGRGAVRLAAAPVSLPAGPGTTAADMGALLVMALLIAYGLSARYRPDDPYQYARDLLGDVLARTQYREA